MDSVAIQRFLHKTLPLANVSELSGASTLGCFYCGHRAAPEEWLTLSQQSFLQQVGRILAQHVRYEQLAQVSRTLSDNPRPTFTLMKPSPLPPPCPPEQEDLRRFRVLCCSDEIKASSGWEHGYHCPHCGIEHQHGLPKTRLQLQRAMHA